MQSSEIKETSVTILTLFASSGTLLCCALPILLVSLGMGAAMITLTNNFPILVTLGEHRNWVFMISGGLLLATGWWMYRPGRTCPGDEQLAKACRRTRAWNVRVYTSSLLIWCIGFIAAYLALPMRIWLEG